MRSPQTMLDSLWQMAISAAVITIAAATAISGLLGARGTIRLDPSVALRAK